jgi:hypothetical protein
MDKHCSCYRRELDDLKSLQIQVSGPHCRYDDSARSSSHRNRRAVHNQLIGNVKLSYMNANTTRQYTSLLLSIMLGNTHRATKLVVWYSQWRQQKLRSDACSRT